MPAHFYLQSKAKSRKRMGSPGHYIALFLLLLSPSISSAKLTTDFYSRSCPNVFSAIKPVVQSAISKEGRIGASLLRLHFHDCFVKGCDASVLLDDTRSFTGEKSAVPNQNSLRGFEVIDKVKAAVENACPGVVSCADILAITARDSVAILGGPFWKVKLGRRDARSASKSAAKSNIPAPSFSLNRLKSSFAAKGLSVKDMVALSGAHTIGQARCTNFRSRIYNETNISRPFARFWQKNCPIRSGNNNIAPLDIRTPSRFDNNYYKDLVNEEGLLHSDQQLFNNGSTDSLVRDYAIKPQNFNSDFVAGMIKMGDISPLTYPSGEIRINCRKIN